MNQPGATGRYSEQDMEAARRGAATDHGRYIALMDLSHFLSNDNVEALLPAAEVVLHRPLAELPSRSLEFDALAPPAPPLPRMMKNLLKDRRRYQRQFITTTTNPQIPEFDQEVVNAAHKALENYQLKELFEKEELSDVRSGQQSQFAQELLFGTMTAEAAECDGEEGSSDAAPPPQIQPEV